MPRTKEEVNSDYGNTCAKLGDIEYKILLIKNQRDELIQKLNELNMEGLELDKQEKEKENGQN